jgi:transposase
LLRVRHKLAVVDADTPLRAHRKRRVAHAVQVTVHLLAGASVAVHAAIVAAATHATRTQVDGVSHAVVVGIRIAPPRRARGTVTARD